MSVPSRAVPPWHWMQVMVAFGCACEMLVWQVVQVSLIGEMVWVSAVQAARNKAVDSRKLRVESRKPKVESLRRPLGIIFDLCPEPVKHAGHFGHLREQGCGDSICDVAEVARKNQ